MDSPSLRASMPTGLRTVNAADGPRITFLEELDTAIAVAAKDLTELVSHARNVADAVFGTQPEPATSATKAPGGGGKSTDIREKLSWLNETIGSLRAQLSRLNAL